MQELRIHIDAQGEVQVEVLGVQGDGCLKLTEGLERRLGEVHGRQMKPEAYQQATESQELKQWGQGPF